MDLSIIIVNWKVRDLLKQTLASIVKNPPQQHSYEIIVIDNDSQDGSVEMVKKEFSQVKLIVNKENNGFSKANNQGVKISKESRNILFLNPDTIVQKQAIEELINFMDSHKDIGLIKLFINLILYV